MRRKIEDHMKKIQRLTDDIINQFKEVPWAGLYLFNKTEEKFINLIVYTAISKGYSHAKEEEKEVENESR